MSELNVPISKLKAGKLVDFKRQPGRGRPSLGKVVGVYSRTIKIENVAGKFEHIKPTSILQIRKERPQRRTKAEMAAFYEANLELLAAKQAKELEVATA